MARVKSIVKRVRADYNCFISLATYSPIKNARAYKHVRALKNGRADKDRDYSPGRYI